MAHEDPLPSPGRVEEELNLVAPPDGKALPPGRSLRLSAAASMGASLSARAELYPKGMAPAAALRLSLGSLAAPGCCPRKPFAGGPRDASRTRPSCRPGRRPTAAS